MNLATGRSLQSALFPCFYSLFFRENGAEPLLFGKCLQRKLESACPRPAGFSLIV